MLQAVADILRRRQAEGWLVGGSVRDRELDRYSPDLDVVVADDAAQVAAEVARALRIPWFALSERHPAYRVMGPEGHLDVAALRGGGILDDLGERDFTVNAMAVPVGGEGIIDPFNGLAHLRQGRLVAVSERIFEDDPLRLMRAARFSHVLGLHPDALLTMSMREKAPLLAGVAAERVAIEMLLTLAGGRAADAVRLWHDLGLLEMVLPEVVAFERLAPTIALIEALDDLLDRLPAWFPAQQPPSAGLLAERLERPVDGSVNRPVALRLAGLTHRLTPQEAGAAGRRLKMSGEMISLLRTVSQQLSEGGALPVAPGGREAVLFLWGATPWEPEVVALAAAASAAVAAGAAAAVADGARGPAPDPVMGDGARPEGLGPARQMMALWAERTLHGIPRPPLDGDSLMRELGLDSGPLLGRVLTEVRLAWEAGEAATTAEALDRARAALDSARAAPGKA